MGQPRAARWTPARDRVNDTVFGIEERIVGSNFWNWDANWDLLAKPVGPGPKGRYSKLVFEAQTSSAHGLYCLPLWSTGSNPRLELAEMGRDQFTGVRAIFDPLK